MTEDEADQVIRGELIDYLQDRDMAQTVGFPESTVNLVEAARLRLAQGRMISQLKALNGEPATIVRRAGSRYPIIN